MLQKIMIMMLPTDTAESLVQPKALRRFRPL